MYRVVSFAVLFTFVSIMLYFHNQYGHNHSAIEASGHLHTRLNIPDGKVVPAISGSVKQDHSGAWLLSIRTDHFAFTPEKAGTDDVGFHEGHAHLYVNGEKINRLYGQYYNLDYFEKGTYTIKVTLHANDHSLLTYKGEEIAFEEIIEVNK